MWSPRAPHGRDDFSQVVHVAPALVHAMYLMTSTRCGISAKQLERELGVTYKTAWRMFTLIRNELMTQDDDQGQLRRGRDGRDVRGRKASPDAYPDGWNVGRQQDARVRHGRAWRECQGLRRSQAHGPHGPQANPRGRRAGPAIFTDESHLYSHLEDAGWYHQKIQHSQDVYVSGNVHTQTIDGFWSLVKRGISGTHYHVSAKWLQGYLNEYAWRSDRRGPAGQGKNRKQLFQELILRSALTSR